MKVVSEWMGDAVKPVRYHPSSFDQIPFFDQK
jgi:hypothetical protein